MDFSFTEICSYPSIFNVQQDIILFQLPQFIQRFDNLVTTLHHNIQNCITSNPQIPGYITPGDKHWNRAGHIIICIIVSHPGLNINLIPGLDDNNSRAGAGDARLYTCTHRGSEGSVTDKSPAGNNMLCRETRSNTASDYQIKIM